MMKRAVRSWRCVLGLAGLVLACGVAMAQPGPEAPTAPAGNAHPQSQALSDSGEVMPFGPTGPSGFSMEKKVAFAAKVDVGPLRDLAVFHDGRVKILGTLARESVATVTGRKDYQDFVPVDGAASAGLPAGSRPAKKVPYDPVFTLLDLAIDPAYYVDKPLVGVEFLPLREAILEGVFGNDAAQVEWWKKQGRVSPAMVAEVGQAVVNKYQFEPSYGRGIDSLFRAMSLYRNGWQNLAMVAPARTDQKWRNLGVLLDGSEGKEAGEAVVLLGSAWRAGDADGVNKAIRTLAAVLPKINAEHYPTTRRTIEANYDAVNPFEWGYWVYFVSLVSLLLAFGTGRKWLVWVGVATLVAAIGLHTFGFVSRSIIAERLAIQNQFESMTGLSLGATLVGLVIMMVRRQWLFGAAAAGVGFMVLITATQTAIPGQIIEREAPILNTSVLLKYHVTTVLVSYGLISLGFMVSLFYLGTYYMARFRAAPSGATMAMAGGGGARVSAAALGLGDDAPQGPRRVLADLDTAQMIVLQLAFWTLGVGILLGAWWADHSWGRWWAFDPKETWALITWIVYLIVIHMRFAVKDRAYWTAILSVIGFGVMLFTYFGVNLLLPGLHAYA